MGRPVVLSRRGAPASRGAANDERQQQRRGRGSLGRPECRHEYQGARSIRQQHQGGAGLRSPFLPCATLQDTHCMCVCIVHIHTYIAYLTRSGARTGLGAAPVAPRDLLRLHPPTGASLACDRQGRSSAYLLRWLAGSVRRGRRQRADCPHQRDAGRALPPRGDDCRCSL